MRAPAWYASFECSGNCRAAAVADGEVGAAYLVVLALAQLLLERPVVHAVYQIERPGPDLDALFFRGGSHGSGGRGEQRCGQEGG
jgi:hypothetical protein